MKPTKPLQNWTPYPNNILDNLAEFTGNEMKVLSLMVRKNLGYTDPNMQFSITYICLKTGMSKPTAISAVNGLLAKETIVHSGTDKRGLRLFDVNWQEPVKKLDRSKTFTGTGKKTLPPEVKNLYPLKETIEIKHNKRKKEADEYISLARLILTLHQEEDSKYTRTDAQLNTWAKGIRLLHQRDNRELDHIEAVIRWAKTPGGFWFPNIMSGDKLRKKFPMLISQIAREKDEDKPKPRYKPPPRICPICTHTLPGNLATCAMCGLDWSKRDDPEELAEAKRMFESRKE